jgi:tRNA uridine 5-carboxymethylaminomethyl modification enzyme
VIQPSDADLEPTLRREYRAVELLKRPDVDYAWLTCLERVGPRVPGAEEYVELTEQIDAQVETEARYAGYVKRQQDEIERNRGTDELPLPENLNYAAIHGLSHEIRQKLARQRPVTIGQASRIPGVTPVAVSLLLVHLKKRRHLAAGPEAGTA